MAISLKTVALFLGVAVVGLAGGGAAAWMYTGNPPGSGDGPGPWRTKRGAGEASADPVQRATIARVGLWALPQSEVVYFHADTDDEGVPLSRNCTYAVRARQDPPTRWWSVTLYRDFFWVDNPQDRYSFSSTTVARNAEGGWQVNVSAAPQDENWLPMGLTDGRFTLSLRLYQPDPGVARDPESVSLPAVEKLTCA